LKKDRAAWTQVFNEKKIPAGAVLSMEDVMKGTIAQSMIREEKIEEIKTKRMSSIAFSIIEN